MRLSIPAAAADHQDRSHARAGPSTRRLGRAGPLDAAAGRARAVRARPLPRLAAGRARARARRLRRALALVGRPTSRASGRRSGTTSGSARTTPYERVLGSREMPGAEWFPGARLNFAEHMLGRDEDVGSVAVVAHSQSREPLELTFGDLREQVARARAGLQRLGVGPGDRVVAYLPNIPETLVAFLASASLGAIWATCPPEFGVRSVLDRLGPARAEGAARGRRLPLRRASSSTAASRSPRSAQRLPSLESVVHVPYAGGADDALPGRGLLGRARRARRGRSSSSPLPFAHPLYVLFSSGHDRAAEGDRPLPRRHPARAPEEPRPELGPAARATGCSGSRRPPG